MKGKNRLIRVYSGTELTVNLLKDKLGQNEISAVIQNDYNSGITAGFSGGVPSAVDLFIQEFDLKKAKKIIRDFTQINQG